jgi:hypothetical protein
MRIAVAILMGLVSTPALADREALDPLNRGHAGVSFSDNKTVGFNVGLDSRLTRVVFIDMGAFASPSPFPEDAAVSSDKTADLVFLRHGIYVAPGLRVPHREKGGVQWDLTARGGFGGVWSTNVDPENATINGDYEIEANPAVLAGLDAQVRKDHFGIRVAGKEYMFKVFSRALREDVVLLKPQFSGELVYQW